ncbi:MAG: energy-coupling factor transporter transmembrane component T [Spirochaetia bacterium]|jgi:energy-coupling factor transport system permease protein|nr:energy-coupling factor transporter transmembrane component T [Spirochaetia bacterium]
MITTTYVPGNSFLHKTDPRIKTILLLTTVPLFFFPLSITAMIMILILLTGTAIYSLGFSRFLQPIKMILPILVFVTILTPPFIRGGDAILSIGETVILTTEGITQTLRLILRFSGITLSFYLFFATTSINYFILTLNWFKLPYRVALIVTIALRYIPYMITIYNNIKDAHKLRGNDYNKKKLKEKLNSIFPTLVSVLIHAIKLIPALSMALELKGIGLETKRSTYSVIVSSNLALQIITSGGIVLLTILIALFI